MPALMVLLQVIQLEFGGQHTALLTVAREQPTDAHVVAAQEGEKAAEATAADGEAEATEAMTGCVEDEAAEMEGAGGISGEGAVEVDVEQLVAVEG
jgi:hypothetical protein